jgi:spermidine/putrescine-binding protein
MDSESKQFNIMRRRTGLSRRDFLRVAALGMGGATAGSILAACAGPTPTPEQVQVPVEVTRIVAGTPVVETQIITATPPEVPTAVATNELNLWAWSIYAPASAIESFQADTKADVHVTYYFGNSELLAKIQAGGTNADIIMPSEYRLNAFTSQGLIQPIDESKIPNFGNLYKSVQNIDYMFYEGKRISVPYAFGVTAMVYNQDQTGGPLDSWTAAWDPKYKGRIVMEDSESWIYATAMLLGYKLSELTQDTDAKLAEIKAKMIEQKPLLLGACRKTAFPTSRSLYQRKAPAAGKTSSAFQPRPSTSTWPTPGSTTCSTRRWPPTLPKKPATCRWWKQPLRCCPKT